MSVLIDQLALQGVVDFFIASGSRSTPLVLAAARHPKARIHRHLDERALGFYALGASLSKQVPVAIITTSGTAVGNLLPAVMEASHASVPLILLTADRPPELRDTASNQTTDQIKIFQNFVRWQFDLAADMTDSSVRSKAADAVHRSMFPQPGPVQINCPLREPLYTTQTSAPGAPILHQVGKITISKSIELMGKGVIIAGKLPKRSDIDSVLNLANRLKWPVFADVLSQARLYPTEEQIKRFDWILDGAPALECVVHFGDRPLSKRLMEWLKKTRPSRYLHISPYPNWVDPSHLLTDRIVSEIPEACSQFAAAADPAWLPSWQALDRQAEEILRAQFSKAANTESQMIQTLSHLDLEERAIFLGTSMPVREGDWFLYPKKGDGFYSNRGLSGIDGNIATAAGIALSKPVLAIIGDMTALHDLNSLSLLKESKHPIALIISNNGGGGIFSHLNVNADSRFEELFAFQHALSFEHAAAMYGLPYYKTDQCIHSLPNTSCIIEFVNSRAENYAFHKTLKDACRPLSFSTVS